MNDEDIKIYLNNLLNEALSDLKDSKPDIAKKKFKIILSHRPDHPKILNLISISYHQLKNYKKALHYILKAIEKNSKEIGFYINLGNIYKDLKKYPESEKAYVNGLKINNSSAELFYNLGVLYVNQHKYQIQLFLKCAE